MALLRIFSQSSRVRDGRDQRPWPPACLSGSCRSRKPDHMLLFCSVNVSWLLFRSWLSSVVIHLSGWDFQKSRIFTANRSDLINKKPLSPITVVLHLYLSKTNCLQLQCVLHQNFIILSHAFKNLLFLKSPDRCSPETRFLLSLLWWSAWMYPAVSPVCTLSVNMLSGSIQWSETGAFAAGQNKQEYLRNALPPNWAEASRIPRMPRAPRRPLRVQLRETTNTWLPYEGAGLPFYCSHLKALQDTSYKLWKSYFLYMRWNFIRGLWMSTWTP